MAKKKKATKKKKSSFGKSIKQNFDLAKLGGMAGGVWGGTKLDDLEFISTWDPKLKAVAKIALGEYGQKQSMIRNLVKNDSIVRGAGDALSVQGITELLTELGFISGVGNLKDDDDLVVVIDGIDDLDVVNEDVLGDDDLDVVNEDILGDDDDDDGSAMYDDVD